MEHLLGPKALARYGQKIDEIPWLGFDHDGTRPVVDSRDQADPSFLNYPLRRGRTEWNVDNIPWSTFQEYGTLAMIQSWFFFGLWESVLQQPLMVQAYVFDCGNHQVLRTHTLRQQVCSFVEAMTNWTEIRIDSFSSQVQLTCRQAAELYTNIMLHHDTSNIELDHAQTVMVDAILRMAILSLEYIEICITQRLRGSHVNKVDIEISGSHGRLLQQRLIKNNWCPSAYEYLRKFNYSSVEYGSLIYRRGTRNQHENCCPVVCIARNVTDNSCIPTHTANSCTCASWFPPLTKLFNILRQGQVPLLSAKAILNHEADASDQTVPYQEGIRVTAFSHVWADGLGSTSEEGLPYCQVERLCHKAATEYFWVDALCIPKDESLRKGSIRSMALIYSKAEIVLVLDSSLQLEPTDELDSEELVVKILTSDWNQRLWTLQEAVLSKTLQFECKDSRVSIEALLGCLTRDSTIYHTPLAGWFEALGSIWLASKNGKTFEGIIGKDNFRDNIIPLGMAINLLSNRSSSKPTDEPFAVAPLLGVDVTGLIHIPGDERMEKLFLDLKHVSTRSVFSHAHKLERPGFRWAPKSLIGSGADYDLFSRQDKFPGIVTKQGLRGRQLVMNFFQELEVQTESMDYRVLDHANHQSYLLCPFPDVEGVPEKHLITGLAICADSVDKMSPGTLYDAIGLRATGSLDRDVPIHILQGHFILVKGTEPSGDKGESEDAQENILAFAPQMQEVTIS